MSIKINTIVALYFLITICIFGSSCTNNDDSHKTIIKSEHTKISSLLDDNIDSNSNLIYCNSFLMAWKALHDQVIKGNIIIEPNTELANQLNRNLQRNNDLYSESYLAFAAELSKENIKEVYKQLMGKFGDQVAQEFSIPQSTNNSKQLFAYSFLYKNLEFPTAFEKTSEMISFVVSGRETSIKGFGVNSFSSSDQLHKKIAKQVAIYDYRDSNDFVISLNSKLSDDEILIAKVVPERTLLQTYIAVMNRVSNAKSSELREHEILKIPKIDFNLSGSFSELENKRIMNKGWEGWSIARAVQSIRFKLDERGAVLKSKAFISAMKAEPPPTKEKPRNFIFDKPFLICLKQKNGHYPYFAMWIGNPELLVKK